MKKIIFFNKIILCTALIFSAVSCKEQVVKTKNLNFSQKTFLLPADTVRGSLNVAIQMEIPESYLSQTILDSINKVLISSIFSDSINNAVFVTKTLPLNAVPTAYGLMLATEYKAENLPTLQEFVKKEPDFVLGTYEHSIEGFTLLNDGNIFSYGYSRNTFNGGAHGLETMNYFNFDMKSGKLLNENTLFTDGYNATLAELIKSGIVEQTEQKDLENSPYYADSIRSNGNFFVSDEGITFVFNPYEIAPYYIGRTEVFVPYAKLTAILREGSPVAYLVKAATK